MSSKYFILSGVSIHEDLMSQKKEIQNIETWNDG